MPKIIIGIDVGGTNTDAVLLRDNQIIATAKTRTSADITQGIASVINEVLETSQVTADEVNFVMIGTTHLLNATLQHKLDKVAIIRLAAPATTAIPPCAGWPKEMHDAVNGGSYIINGGYEYSGKPIAHLDNSQLANIAKELREKNIKSVAITGVFSHVNPEQEIEAAGVLRRYIPDLNVSLSHQMVGKGLLARENATVLNAALLPTYNRVCQGIENTLIQVGLKNARIFLSHNDGTLEAIKPTKTTEGQQQKPVFSVNSGTSNSMHGGAEFALLMGIEDEIVGDIGGTTADIGAVINGSPIEKNSQHVIGGVTLNSPNIPTLSIGLGGGSIIKCENGNISIGPESVSNRLEEAICFGGSVLTATDIAVLKGRINIPSANLRSSLYPDEATINRIDDLLHQKFADGVIEVWSNLKVKPRHLFLVGGGSRLFDREKLLKLLVGKISEITIPNYAEVANALGAAKGEICGTHTGVMDYHTITRDKAKQIVIDLARANAVANGANPKDVRVKYLEETSIPYVTGAPTIITVKVAGSVCDNINATTHLLPQQALTGFSTKYINTGGLSAETGIPFPAVAGSSLSLPRGAGAVSTPPLPSSTQKSTVEGIINKTDIDAIAIGCEFLGSGGGGETDLAKLMVRNSIDSGKTIRCIPLSSVPNHATGIMFGGMGSPPVFAEKLPSKEEIVTTFEKIQARLGKKIDFVVILEIGGANGLFALLAAAEFGIPVVTADGMGRALPGLHMITPLIEGGIKQFIASIGSATSSRVVEAKDAKELEDSTRTIVGEMGSAAFIAYAPMDGETAKRVCIDGTLKVAKEIGNVVIAAKEAGQDPIPQLDQYLMKTEYGGIEELFSGRIEDVIRNEEPGFSVGGILIKNSNDEEVQIVFQNEYLLARKKIEKPEKAKHAENVEQDEKTGFYYEKLSIVPHLIIVVDYETSLPISCGQLRYGQQVRVLTMNAPRKLLTERALKVVGPQAFDLKRLTPALSVNPALVPETLFGGKTGFGKRDKESTSLQTSLVLDLTQLQPPSRAPGIKPQSTYP